MHRIVLIVALALAVAPVTARAASLAESGYGPLRDLPRLSDVKASRASSADPTGANNDFVGIPAGDTKVIFDVNGPGCIRHLWVTLKSKSTRISGEPDYHLRWIVVRMYWDGEETPSVEAPLGDFFGLGHATYYSYYSLPMSAAVRKGLNCYFPMPFNEGARIEIENQGEFDVEKFYFNVDYERYDEPVSEDYGYFHAMWRRENPTPAVEGVKPVGRFEDNYVILDATGRGRYLGCNLSVHSLQPEWWGEGDEMIAIDRGTPNILGTGTEDYFCCAWGFPEPFSAPYFGIAHMDSLEETEKTTVYRWHIDDPITFDKSIKVTMEHGEGNHRADDFSSTAYWYQTEPHKRLPDLLPVEERFPRDRLRPAPPPPEGSPRQAAIAPMPRAPMIQPGLDDADMMQVSGATRREILWLVWVPLVAVVVVWRTLVAVRRLSGRRNAGE